MHEYSMIGGNRLTGENSMTGENRLTGDNSMMRHWCIDEKVHNVALNT